MGAQIPPLTVAGIGGGVVTLFRLLFVLLTGMRLIYHYASKPEAVVNAQPAAARKV